MFPSCFDLGWSFGAFGEFEDTPQRFFIFVLFLALLFRVVIIALEIQYMALIIQRCVYFDDILVSTELVCWLLRLQCSGTNLKHIISQSSPHSLIVKTHLPKFTNNVQYILTMRSPSFIDQYSLALAPQHTLINHQDQKTKDAGTPTHTNLQATSLY
jgi:hypothetical protein